MANVDSGDARYEMLAPTDTVTGSVVRLVAMLKPYKELAAIIVFFAGGAAWVVGYFATKAYVDEVKNQVAEVRCLHEESVKTLQAQILFASAENELLRIGRRANALSTKGGALSASEADEVIELNARAEVVRKQRDAALTRTNPVSDSRDCKKS